MKKYLIALTALVCMTAAANAQTSAPAKTSAKKTEVKQQPATKASKSNVSSVTPSKTQGVAIKRKHHKAKAKKAMKPAGK